MRSINKVLERRPMLASASASAQIALAVKATLDGYNLPLISNANNLDRERIYGEVVPNGSQG
jgi:hypothetical protein